MFGAKTKRKGARTSTSINVRSFVGGYRWLKFLMVYGVEIETDGKRKLGKMQHRAIML